MAAVDLCTFSHGLGIYIRILSLAFAREKIIEWLNEHKSTAAMNYFLIRIRLIDQYIPFNLNNIYLENNQNILVQYIKHSKYRQDSETAIIAFINLSPKINIQHSK
jgi:hypothetical protein